jgi:glycosyltransferase involved in cell wall biosynthesis
MVIVPSQSTKTDVMRLYGVNPEKIAVIYEGYDEEVYKPQDNLAPIEEVKREYNISGKYILYVGTLEPRKNIPRLVEAFHSLKKGEVEHKLVVAGKLGWLYKDIFTTVTKLNLENEVIFTGYIPQKELPILMGGAEVFAYPSLYEGFGLPPLEAMACGTPVIASNTSSLPEVIGDAGILVDPYNSKEIAQAMYRLISDEGLRQQMHQRGLNRAKMFSWEKTAQQTLKVFEIVHRSQ